MPDIAHMFATTEGYARRVVHEFNKRGSRPWTQKWSSGRQWTIDGRTIAPHAGVRRLPASTAAVRRQAVRGLRQLLPHKHNRVDRWCAANDVELVFTPHASSLNWIEREFAAVRRLPTHGCLTGH